MVQLVLREIRDLIVSLDEPEAPHKSPLHGVQVAWDRSPRRSEFQPPTRYDWPRAGGTLCHQLTILTGNIGDHGSPTLHTQDQCRSPICHRSDIHNWPCRNIQKGRVKPDLLVQRFREQSPHLHQRRRLLHLLCLCQATLSSIRAHAQGGCRTTDSS